MPRSPARRATLRDPGRRAGGSLQRRILFLIPHDRPNEPEGLYKEGAPGEAVDPRTLEPRRVGEKTPRSQGKRRSELVVS
nr:DUF6009 family protein [Streptomyces sp. t39]